MLRLLQVKLWPSSKQHLRLSTVTTPQLAFRPLVSRPSTPDIMPLLIPKPLNNLSDLPSSYVKEREVAIAAVAQASIVAQKIFKTLVNEETITKQDKSPVTVGDYTAQALVNLLISYHFPSDAIVGEEDSGELREKGQEANLLRIVSLADESLSSPLDAPTDEAPWVKLRSSKFSQSEWLDVIDRGNHVGGLKTGRMWTLDPIDGTKGFLRGGQYAVCLALIVDGQVVLGVMGTPNLRLDFRTPDSPIGTLFFAERGHGAYQRSLSAKEGFIYEPIMMVPRSLDSLRSEGTFCESVEAAHSDQQLNAQIVKELKMLKGSEPVRMDSQAKYCSISRGDGDVYLRFPTKADYEEKIWDHAAGSLIVQEAGGAVTDMRGDALDFSLGRTLKENKGIVACHAGLHPHIIEAVSKVSNLPPKKL